MYDDQKSVSFHLNRNDGKISMLKIYIHNHLDHFLIHVERNLIDSSTLVYP